MRLFWVLNIIICASLLTGSGHVFAANTSHKPGKTTKHSHSSSKKAKVATKGPRDIWARIRSGMHIPRPSPVPPELAALIAQEPDETTNTSATTINLLKKQLTSESVKPSLSPSSAPKFPTECAPFALIKTQSKKSAPPKKTDASVSAPDESRVHVRLDVKSRAHKLYVTNVSENLDASDAEDVTEKIPENEALEASENLIPTNSIDAEMNAFNADNAKPEVETAPPTSKLVPCAKKLLQTPVASTDAESSVDIEELRRQAQRYERVKEFITRYSQNPDFLMNITERSRPYLFHIVESLSKAKMPMELALLPIVESAYQPKAESPKSAAGLWQFIPSTGQDFDLEQTEQYDDRLDIVASTDAAIHYLSFLKQHYNGDWLLALAAYNCGQGAVDAAIALNKTNNLDTDFWSLQLPDETKAYVPRLLALSTIFANPGNYKLKLAKIKNEAYFVKVNVAHVIDVNHLIDKDFSAIAQLADLSHDQFNLLNPGYLTDTLSSAHPFTFLIPVTNVKQLSQRLRMLAKLAIDDQKSIPAFSIVRTVLAEPVQTQFKLPFISLDVKTDNDKTRLTADPKNIAGLSLIATLLKGSQQTQHDQPFVSLNLEQTKVITPRMETIQSGKLAIKPSPALKDQSKAPNQTLHALRKGETLKYLAKRYQVTEEAIRAANHFDRNQTFRSGQAIKIPNKKLNVATLEKKLPSGLSKRQVN